jgi:hypothetical protein
MVIRILQTNIILKTNGLRKAQSLIWHMKTPGVMLFSL